MLNQIGRRLTETLENERRRHRLLLMLDEFPALGRLDFFESQLAFMAGYGNPSMICHEVAANWDRAATRVQHRPGDAAPGSGC